MDTVVDKPILLLICLVLCISSPALGRETIVISGINVDSAVTIDAERALAAAYNALDYDVVIKRVPAERSLILANSGEVDGELLRIEGINRTYKNLIQIPIPLVKMELMAFTKSRYFKIDGWKSLKPYRIGIKIGIKAMEKNTQDLKIEPLLTFEQTFQQLQLERIDIALVTRTRGLELTKKMELTDIIMLEPPVDAHHLFHYIHKKNEALAKPLEEELLKMNLKIKTR